MLFICFFVNPDLLIWLCSTIWCQCLFFPAFPKYFFNWLKDSNSLYSTFLLKCFPITSNTFSPKLDTTPPNNPDIPNSVTSTFPLVNTWFTKSPATVELYPLKKYVKHFSDLAIFSGTFLLAQMSLSLLTMLFHLLVNLLHLFLFYLYNYLLLFLLLLI